MDKTINHRTVFLQKVAILFLVLFFSITHAQQLEFGHVSLTGSEIIAGAIRTVADDDSLTLEHRDEYASVLIQLQFLPDMEPYLHTSYELKLNITPINEDGTPLNTYLKTLKIEYNPFANAGNFNDLTVTEIKHKYGAIIEVVSFYATNLEDNTDITTTPDNIELSAKLIVERYYQINENSAPSFITVNFTSSANSAGTLVDASAEINWSPIDGAIEYELEYTWIDRYSNDGSLLGAGVLDLNERDFELNNTRIVTKKTFFEIPLIYSSGFVVCRVRAVARNLDKLNQNYYTSWSTENLPDTAHISDWGTSNYFVVNAHEKNMNWQFQASFAEEGKKKEVVSYFDGTLRNRQTVTKINSDDNTIIGEVIYDTQGRPAIEVLPVPISNNDDDVLKYFPNFNLNSNNAPYTHEDFDWSLDIDLCDPLAGGMSTTNGASQYYGSFDIPTNTFQDYVPDAQNFPFSQIEYTPDNTGRIRSKSGVGITHQLGSGHEMKYFYSVPAQEELNRIFGYRVGYSQHYKKNMVVDPNGQVSISYIDPQGRTIATALAGNSPNNLISIYDGPIVPTEIDLLNKVNDTDPDTDFDNNIPFSTGDFGINNDGLGVSRQVLITSNSTLEFDYEIDMQGVFVPENPNPEDPDFENCDLQYPYVFNVGISLKDDCGVDRISDFNSTETSFPKAFETIVSDPLLVGSYTLNKQLTIDNLTLNNYIDEYRFAITDPNSDCFIDPNGFSPDADIDLCNVTCASCKDSLGLKLDYVINALTSNYGYYEFEGSHIDNSDDESDIVLGDFNGAIDFNGNDIDPLEVELFLSRFNEEWDLLLDLCNTYCSDVIQPTAACNISGGFLLQDVSPHGQYGGIEFTEVEGEDNVFTILDPLSVFNEDNILYSTTGTGGDDPLNWRFPKTPYSDAFGMPIEITVTPDPNEEGSFIPAVDDEVTILEGSDSNGSYQYILPQHLADVGLFLSVYWLPSFANSLVDFHPETCYLTYTEALCVNFDSNELNTDGFDGFLLSIDYFYNSDGGALNPLIDLNNYINFWQKDPYFTQIPDTDSESFESLEIYQYRKNIMIEALTHQYENFVEGSNDLNLLEFAYSIVICNGVSDCTIPVDLDSWGDLNNYNLSDGQKNLIWQKFKTNYLSLKEKIKYVFLNIYAKEHGCFNGCIGGTDEGSILTVLSDYPTIINGISSHYSVGSPQFCNMINPEDYEEKERRFMPADLLYDSSIDDGEVIEGLGGDGDYISWVETGKCPLLFDLEIFLNGYFTSIDPNNNNNYYDPTLDHLHSGQYITPDFYEALGGTVPYNGDITYFPTKSNSDLTIALTGIADPDPIKLEATGYDWNDYTTDLQPTGSEWRILSVSQFFYDGYDTNGNQEFEFKFLAQIIKLNQGVVEFVEVVFSGSTIVAIGECGLDDDGLGEVLDDQMTDPDSTYGCTKQAKFKRDFIILLNALKDVGQLENEDGYNLAGLTEYTTSFLPEFLGDNPNSTTAKWIANSTNDNNSSGYKIINTPTNFDLNINDGLLSNVNINTFESISILNTTGTNDIIKIYYTDTNDQPDFFNGDFKGGLLYACCYITVNTDILEADGTFETINKGRIDFADGHTVYQGSSVNGINPSDQNAVAGFWTASVGANGSLRPYFEAMNDLGVSHPHYTSVWGHDNLHGAHSGEDYNSPASKVITATPLNAESIDGGQFFYVGRSTNDNFEGIRRLNSGLGIRTLLTGLIIGESYRVEFDASGASGTQNTILSSHILPTIKFGNQEAQGTSVNIIHNNNQYNNNYYDHNIWGHTEVFFIAQSNQVVLEISLQLEPEVTDITQQHLVGEALDNIEVNLHSNSGNIGIACDICIPQQVIPVTCTEKYQSFLTYMDFDANYESQLVVGYVLPGLLVSNPIENDEGIFIDEGKNNFCAYNYQYLVDSYLVYLTENNIFSVDNNHFISIAEFGDTNLHYGYADINNVIGIYKNSPEYNTHSWKEWVNTIYLPANSEICPPAILPHGLYILPDTIPPCDEMIASINSTYNQEAYDNYINGLIETFKQEYITKGITEVVENFNMLYDDKEYQYTLYYYDQAGNLTQTVPPEGTTRLDGSNNDAINQHRYAGQLQENTSLVPNHTLLTNYEYNSLNQLVKQQTPDGGITKFAYDDLGRIIASQNAKQNVAVSGLLMGEEYPGNFSFSENNTTITKINGVYKGGYGLDILEGNGYVEWEVLGTFEENRNVWVGLSYASNDLINPESPATNAHKSIDYKIHTYIQGTEDYYKIRFFNGTIAGTYGSNTQFAIDDVLRVERINGEIKMYQQGNLMFTFTETNPGEPMRIDFAMKRPSTKINNLKLVNYDGSSEPVEKFSYTQYDGLGRIIEAGEINTPENQYHISDEGKLIKAGENIPVNDFVGSYIKKEVTKTFYDQSIDIPSFSVADPITNSSDLFEDEDFALTLRNRVSGVLYFQQVNSTSYGLFENGIFYNYDIHGNVKELAHYFTTLKDNTLNDKHIKRVAYDYDLISGNVKKVVFQKDKTDQFIHRYSYDADNRITQVETSKDGVIWEKDASYQYYQHGPLARTELGDKKVQGVDYVYTLQGWLKSVNGEYIANADNDFGQDGVSSSLVAKDAFGYSLGYFEGDYSAVGIDASANFSLSDPTANNLYNGNIRQMVTSIRESGDQMLNSQVNLYQYDQLNRIKGMTSKSWVDETPSNAKDSYATSYTYDRNGNLQTLLRDVFDEGNPSNPTVDMDDFTYNYKSDTNQLTLINDLISEANFSTDIDDQEQVGLPYDEANEVTHNYLYDEIGQLIMDRAELITIDWRVDGKVERVNKYNAGFQKIIETIEFEYDGLGNRISKNVLDQVLNVVKGYHYMRDAQGNVLSVVETLANPNDVLNNTFTNFETKEHHIYGSSRLGIEQKNVNSFVSTNANVDTNSDMALELDNEAYGTWLPGTITNETDHSNVNYELSASLLLNQTIPLNDSLQVANLAFVNSTIVASNNSNRLNELRFYIKNDGGTYKPSFFTTSTIDSLEIKKVDVVSQEGISETEILTKGMNFKYSTLFVEASNTYKATLILNDSTYDGSNALLISNSIASTTNSVDVNTPSTIGGYGNTTFQVKNLDYRLTTEYNTLDDNFTFTEGTGTPHTRIANIEMTMTANNAYWLASNFTDDLATFTYNRDIGDRRYELSNHLGNVLSVVSDKKIPTLAGGSLTYFNADVKSYNDYYPFGTLLNNRHLNTSDYRYGFQGQEMDDEIKGEGNSLNYTFRMHDPRVGRFGAIDPLTTSYPYYSPYSFSGNKVIAFGEIEGLEEGWVIHGEKILKVEGLTEEVLNSFQTQELAEAGLSIGMKTPKLLDSYMQMLEFQKNLPSAPYTKPATIVRQLTTVEQYPQHFPGATMGPQMVAGAEEIVTDALGIGIANKFYKVYKVWKKSKLVRKTVKAANNLAQPEFINNADEAFSIWKSAQKKAVANVNNSGKTVLGSFPEYIQMAKKNGNSYFDIGKTWDELAKRGQNVWDVNKVFLDKVASQGDDIIITLGKNADGTTKDAGKYLKKEIEYLTKEKGYIWKDASKTILTKPKG